ncbi:MAG TPA: hypothetical protein VHI13_10350 [Candidatus Kapabacteria bacterium]|nr:hypothetical protein [Candidatus Kapabacteria bacterium]
MNDGCRKTYLVFCALGFLMWALALPAARAQTTTQKTKPSQIGPSDRTAKPPRPDAPNVCVQYTITVDAKTGEVTLKAKFTNKGGTEKKFIFCQMIATSTDTKVQMAACDIYYDAKAKQVKCSTSTRKFDQAMNSYHFGCKLVTVAGNGTTDVDYGKATDDGFKGKKASDFYVTYADYVELPTGATFDDASCKDCFGKDKSTGLTGTPAMMGDWYLPVLPFTDPYIVYQPIDSNIRPAPPEYRSITLGLGVPSNFPATVTQLPHNVPGPPPSVYTVPLNLFDVHTMDADSTQSWIAQLSLAITGDAAGATFTTTPANGSTFTIRGMDEPTGTIDVTTPAPLAQGDTSEMVITVHDPDTDSTVGDQLFAQKGFFVNDTHPPVATGRSVGRVGADSLSVQVTATDSTTEPLAASFWYSTDGGATWDVSGMQSSTDLLDDASTRTFNGGVSGIARSRPVEYFFLLQDAVFNYTYYGIGTIPPDSITSVDLSSGDAGDLWIRGIPDPGNRSVTVRYMVPQAAAVTVRIIDMFGREVARPVEGEQMTAGLHQVVCDVRGLPSGTYMASVTAGRTVRSQRFLLVR